ncbi:MAG TPA: hypothetical protein VIU11_11170 [Nakamurella sp.]
MTRWGQFHPDNSPRTVERCPQIALPHQLGSSWSRFVDQREQTRGEYGLPVPGWFTDADDSIVVGVLEPGTHRCSDPSSRIGD